jgi:4-oxalocrotonate tautomerase
MPVITVETGRLNKEQKVRLVKDLTTTAANIMDVNEQAIIVFLKENESENIGFGGQLLSNR